MRWILTRLDRVRIHRMSATPLVMTFENYLNLVQADEGLTKQRLNEGSFLSHLEHLGLRVLHSAFRHVGAMTELDTALHYLFADADQDAATIESVPRVPRNASRD